MKRLEKYADYAYALLRMLAGIMFAFHGAQKLLGVLGGSRPPVGSQLWIAGIIELFGGLAVLYCFVFLLIASKGTVKWGLTKRC
jgi:putative oxidoreductase